MINRLTRRQFCLMSVVGSAKALTYATNSRAQSVPPYLGDWLKLFNGENLDGWTFYQEGVGTKDKYNCVTIKDGMIHMLNPDALQTERPSFGHIATQKSFSNFHLQFEFKFGEARYEPRLYAKRNSGLLYHMAPDLDKVWPNSVEFQLQEGNMGEAILINAQGWPGGDVAGTPAWPNQVPIQPYEGIIIPPEPRRDLERQRVKHNGDFEKREGWNLIELIAIEDKAAHLINGRIVNSIFDLKVQSKNNRSIFKPLSSGRIGLEIEGAEAYFRNIKIRQFKTA